MGSMTVNTSRGMVGRRDAIVMQPEPIDRVLGVSVCVCRLFLRSSCLSTFVLLFFRSSCLARVLSAVLQDARTRTLSHS